MLRSDCARSLAILAVGLVFLAAETASARGRGGGGAGRAGGGFGGVSAPGSAGAIGRSAGGVNRSPGQTFGKTNDGFTFSALGQQSWGQSGSPRQGLQSRPGTAPGARPTSASQLQGFLGNAQGGPSRPAAAGSFGSQFDQLKNRNQGRPAEAPASAAIIENKTFEHGAFDRSQLESAASQSAALDSAAIDSFAGAEAAAQVKSSEAFQQGQQQAQAAVSDWQTGPEPFSPAWYAEHPNAWQATHPYADEAALVTVAAVSSWVAATAYPVTALPATEATTVVVSEGDTYNTYVDESAEAPASPPAPTATAEEWLTLGVFRVSHPSDGDVRATVQLAVNRQGDLRGAHVDQASGSLYELTGRVDTASETAAWQVEGQTGIVYSAPLSGLVADSGTLTVRGTTGEATWSLTRQP